MVKSGPGNAIMDGGRPGRQADGTYFEEAWTDEDFRKVFDDDSKQPRGIGAVLQRRAGIQRRVKLSTYEMKKGLFERLDPSDFSFLAEEFGADRKRIGELDDDEASDLWHRLKETAESENSIREHAAAIISKASRWAVPCWDVPAWMTEW